MTKLLRPGAHLTSHSAQIGHFDIGILIDQPALNIDLFYCNIWSFLYKQDHCNHADILIFPVRPKLAKLWSIK